MCADSSRGRVRVGTLLIALCTLAIGFFIGRSVDTHDRPAAFRIAEMTHVDMPGRHRRDPDGPARGRGGHVNDGGVTHASTGSQTAATPLIIATTSIASTGIRCPGSSRLRTSKSERRVTLGERFGL